MSKGYDEYLRMRRNSVGQARHEWQDHVDDKHWPAAVRILAKTRQRFVPTARDADWIARELGDVEVESRRCRCRELGRLADCPDHALATAWLDELVARGEPEMALAFAMLGVGSVPVESLGRDG